MALTSEISALTQKYLIPKLVDNIFASNALFQRAKSKGWYDTIDGGTTIDQPLVYGVTGAAGRYSGAGTLNTADTAQITSASWDWKEYYASIPITRIDELKNSGKSAVVNHVKSKVQLAEKTLKDTLGTDLFGDGSTTNSIQGIKLMTAVTGTYGNIAKGTYSWHQAQQDTSTTAFSLSAFQALMGDCQVDSDKPTLAVTTQDIFDDCWASTQPQQRFADETTLKAGFSNILINGIPVLVDSHCDTYYMYLLNENYMSLCVHKDENFRFAPFRQPTNQNIKVAQIFWTGALTSSNCRMQGVFTALA